MNKGLIKKWNNRVGKTDSVFFLGDFALTTKEELIHIGQQLHGIKTIVLGNHDRRSPSVYTEAGFKYVSKYPILLEEKYLLSHQPTDVLREQGIINIHGHTHDDERTPAFTSNSFCVSVERIHFRPIKFEEIEEKITTLRKLNGRF